jgi:hypothetical protein
MKRPLPARAGGAVGGMLVASSLAACALIVGDPQGLLPDPADAGGDAAKPVPEASETMPDAGNDGNDAIGACAFGTADDGSCAPTPCTTTAGTFGYAPSNFNPAAYQPPASATTDCNGTYSSTSHTFTTGGCAGQAPVIVPSAAQLTAGHGVDVLVFKSLIIAATSTLNLVGANPVILAVYGDAQIHGTIDASASGATPGPGGNACPAVSNGADAGPSGAWESGGGGAGTATGNPGLAAGKAQGSGPVPLSGGCSGSEPFVVSLGFAPAAGAGGGAVQISAAGSLDLMGGIVKANGSNGGGGEPGKCANLYPAQNGTGGAGGGSGGAILLEGTTVMAGTTAAAGGSGGAGGPAPSPNSQAGGMGGPGGPAGAGGTAGSPGIQKGAAPTMCSWGGYWSGGGGGGGGGGYVKTNAAGPCLCGDAACAL